MPLIINNFRELISKASEATENICSAESKRALTRCERLRCFAMTQHELGNPSHELRIHFSQLYNNTTFLARCVADVWNNLQSEPVVGLSCGHTWKSGLSWWSTGPWDATGSTKAIDTGVAFIT